jgi:transposase
LGGRGNEGWAPSAGGPRHRPGASQRFVASVANPATFKSGRDLAACIGLAPRQNSSGGKERVGGITKAGNGYLRRHCHIKQVEAHWRLSAASYPASAKGQVLTSKGG